MDWGKNTIFTEHPVYDFNELDYINHINTYDKIELRNLVVTINSMHNRNAIIGLLI